MNRHVLLIVLVAILPATVHASETSKQPDSFLCMADKSTGFKYDEHLKIWDHARFRSDIKYIISLSPNREFNFVISEVGTKRLRGFCKKGFNEYGMLFCATLTGEFRFNRNNGRFLLTELAGYYSVGAEGMHEIDETSDTPLLQIGTCAPFSTPNLYLGPG